MGTIVYCENYESTREMVIERLIELYPDSNIITGNDFSSISDDVKKEINSIEVAITDEGFYKNEIHSLDKCSVETFIIELRKMGYDGPIIYAGEDNNLIKESLINNEISDIVLKFSTDYETNLIAKVQKYICK